MTTCMTTCMSTGCRSKERTSAMSVPVRFTGPVGSQHTAEVEEGINDAKHLQSTRNKDEMVNFKMLFFVTGAGKQD